MKMVMVVVPANTAERVLDALINAGYTATFAETHGGMLRQTQSSLFIAVKTIELDIVLDLIKNNCHSEVKMSTHRDETPAELDNAPVTADLGGAIAFVWDIDRIETF